MAHNANNTFTSVQALVEAYKTDTHVQQIVSNTYGPVSSETLASLLELATMELLQDRLLSIDVCLENEVHIGGYVMPSVTLLVAVFCRGSDLISRYSLNGGIMLEMMRIPDSASCTTL